MTTWLVAGWSRPGYSAASDAISELGEVGASTAPAMSAAFVAFGLLGLPFAIGLRRWLPGSARLRDACAVAAAVCGLSTVGAAVFPCSPGCPGAGATVTDTGHAVVATVGYLALMATPLLAGAAAWRSPGWRRYARWSVAAGVTGSLLMLAWALGLAGPGLGGALQRTFNTLADVWWAWTGVLLLRDARAGGSSGT